MQAKKCSFSEVWSDDSEAILLVKRKGGGFNTYILADATSVNGELLINQPGVSNPVSDLKLAVAEEKMRGSNA